MFKKYKTYIFILIGCFVVLIFIQYNIPKPLNWSPTFSNKDKIPYGTRALFSLLPELFTGKNISVCSQPAYNILENDSALNKNYIFFSYYFNPDKLDTKSLLKFAERGNSIFIASNYFAGKFADTLKLETSYFFAFKNLIKDDSLLNDENFGLPFANFDTVKINFSNKNLHAKQYYTFPKGMYSYYFTSFDTAKTSVIGTNADSSVNFIRIKYGKGNFFLHALPQAFSNYCFTDEKNSEYAYKALSCLPPENILWDEYYKYGNEKRQSPLALIFANPTLLAAYYTLLAGLFLFVLFGGKRRQRVIPVVEPLKNTTLEFVDIVGTLYFHQADHKNICDKKINYFLDNIRTKFNVKTNSFEEEFIKRISALSGIEEEKVKETFRIVSYVGGRAVISQEELLRLNSVIEDFQKKSKR